MTPNRKYDIINRRKAVDTLNHAEYKRINPSAEAAILFVHGIVGTPNHFTEFVVRVPEEAPLRKF